MRESQITGARDSARGATAFTRASSSLWQIPVNHPGYSSLSVAKYSHRLPVSHGYCYGRIIAIERGYRQLSRYQQDLSGLERLLAAQAIVQAKLLNSRVLLQRQQRRFRS